MTALIAVNLVGVSAVVWPLVLGVGERTSPAGAHAADAPVILALALPLLLVVALDAARGEGDARLIAVLGALVAVNAFTRIPTGPTGEGFMFVLPILAGWWMGARFAFLLGAFSVLVSAVLTGGVGPWLPFQMFALGWVGAGAGLARRMVGGRAPRLWLGAYAYASSIAFGYVMTLFFWPFLGTGDALGFEAGVGFVETVVRYTRFWALTSLPWDTARALLANVPLVVVLARPVGALLERTDQRLTAAYTAS